MTEKPLFVPLKKEYYRLFINGSKKFELRKYGARWNEKTCRVGRSVILSEGYGKNNRTSAIIVSFERVAAANLSPMDQLALRDIYGSLDFDLARIGLKTQG